MYVYLAPPHATLLLTLSDVPVHAVGPAGSFGACTDEGPHHMLDNEGPPLTLAVPGYSDEGLHRMLAAVLFGWGKLAHHVKGPIGHHMCHATGATRPIVCADVIRMSYLHARPLPCYVSRQRPPQLIKGLT